MNHSKPLFWLTQFNRFWIGSDQQPTFHRVHHLLLLLTCFFDVASAIFNFYFLNVPALYNFALLALGMLQIVLWYFSRFRHRFKSMALIYVFIMFFVALPANWFMNGGSYGPTLAFIYISVIYSVVVLYEIEKLSIFSVVVMIGLPVVLYLVEFYHPESIEHYGSNSQRIDDLIFSNVASLTILIAMMVVYTRTLKREVGRANRYARQLRLVGETDILTQLKNRAYSVRALKSTERVGRNFNVLMLDIDHFKNINDTYGHSVGDDVLKQVSSLLKLFSSRHGAMVSRYGGEEFLLVTFFHTYQQTIQLAEELRLMIEEQVFVPNQHHYSNVTVSVGVATSEQYNDGFVNAIKRADKALYSSKNHGRNLVSAYDESLLLSV